MKTHKHAWLILSVVALLFAAAPVLACPQYMSCTYGVGPCSGELSSGFRIDLGALSTGGGAFTWYTGLNICYQICTYDMRAAGGERWTMDVTDWGCDGSGLAWPNSGTMVRRH